jgi:hypothetical protein
MPAGERRTVKFSKHGGPFLTKLTTCYSADWFLLNLLAKVTSGV